MLKKTISVLLILCALSGCLLIPASAESDAGVISVRLKSDVAGCLYLNSDNFIEILSDNVILDPYRAAPVSVSDYAGTVDFCPLVAGRTYFVSYELVAADGFTLPEELTEDNIKIECDKGVTVLSTHITKKSIRNEDGTMETSQGLLIRSRLVVDSNHFYKRVFGFLYDVYLKIRAWSLY